MPNQSKIITAAVDSLNRGGIIIFPTDTAFGIGCRLDKTDSVDRLFALRKRPLTQATPVLVSSVAMALEYYNQPSEIIRTLAEKYWPGALTIVAGCKTDLVYPPVRGNGPSIGLRMPNHPLILEIIRRVGVPVLGPSANFHNALTPHAFTDLDPELIRLVDIVVPGVCTTGGVSTVVDCSDGSVKVIRPGAIAI
jgi:L-threonylcarbamoyladenylate synthase